jgi:hypothetical protein
MKKSRRKFLLGMSSLGLTAYSSNIAFSVEENISKCDQNNNSVIYLFLSGGPTHIETFNPIPNATSDRKSVIGDRGTKTPGIAIGGLWEKISTISDKFCIVNSFHHSDPNHESAVHWMMTGERSTPNAAQKWPSYGSVIVGQYGANINSGLPTYVKLNPIQHDGASWMGGKYMGYGASGEGVKDLMLKEKERFHNRTNILKSLDNPNVFKNNDGVSKNWIELRNQAINILLGTANEAFLVEKDPEFDLYKKDQLGKDLLTAIRLVERGVKFVTINYGGWDMHQNINQGLNKLIPPLDNYLYQYFKSVEKREINKRNMLVMTGDFGRTPKVNKDAGRDHWPHLVPLFIASDSYEMGRVIGKSDLNAERPDDSPYEPEDLKWTIFDHMGIHKNANWISIEQRPMMFIKEQAKNILEIK